MNSHEHLGFIQSVQKQERQTFLKGFDYERFFTVHKDLQVTLLLLQVTLDGDIISRRVPVVYGIYRRQMVMQTPGRSLPALQHWCALPTHPGRKG